MNAIPAQEIKRRGISAVDKALKNGAVHVVKNNMPSYVILSEEQYENLVQKDEEAYIDRIKRGLREAGMGKAKKYKTADELIRKFRLEK